MPLLAVNQLTVHFNAGGKIAKAVDGVSFNLSENRVLGLVGESGCGKTITALSILRLVPKRNRAEFSGQIEFDGVDLMPQPESSMRKIRGSKISMIFQEPMTSLNPVLTVGTQIGEVYRLHLDFSGEQARNKGIDLLAKVGIEDGGGIWKAYPGQLSGGMRQRVMIAMAMAASPRLLIADEPTTALDVTVQAQVLGLIDKMKARSGAAVLLVTHDLGVVAEICDDVCVMYAGQVAEKAEVKTIFDNPLHPYTEGLLQAVSTLDEGKLKTAIFGQVEPATSYPSGCRFHPRCKKAMDVCKRVVPELQTIDKTRIACHLYP